MVEEETDAETEGKVGEENKSCEAFVAALKLPVESKRGEVGEAAA